MTELLTAAQMRAIEEEAIASGRVTGLELMERAGAGVVEAVLEEWPDLAEGTHRAVVLCGPGNNGGDGFVVARLLQERGWDVEVFLYGDPEKLPPDAKVNYGRWVELAGVHEMSWPALKPVLGSHCDLTVEALFGIGMTRSLKGEVWHELFHALHDRVVHHHLPTVAVDIRAGVHSDTGAELGGAFDAGLTVAFHRAKLGHYLGFGHNACGRLVVADIGLGKGGLRVAPKLLTEASPGLSFLDKWFSDHKYTHGHALVLTGGAGRTGAARLAARGALRVGAGLVTLGVPGSAQMECAAHVTAIMLRRIEDGAGLAEVLEDPRLNALCLGPGLGVERARALVPVALGCRAEARPTEVGVGRASARHAPSIVLDADALTAFAQDPATLFAILHERCVLTPHGGEFARLFPDIAGNLHAPVTNGPAYSKVDATRDAAKRAGCVVLFKGPDTVIADPNGRCSVNAAVYDRAAPWLATAGSGDVLAGMICGLMARGFSAMQAAETAAWLHVEAARSFGPGLIAEDLPEELPKVFRALGL